MRGTLKLAVCTCLGSGLLLLLAAGSVYGQGMAGGNAAPAPRPKFSGKAFPAHLADVAPQAGLDMEFVCGRPDRKEYIIEANGTGVAFVDYDGDGWLDVFLVNGFTLDGFSGSPPTNRLYRNERDGKFTDVTRRAGLDHFGWGNGVCAGDYDNDGDLDLYVTYWGPNTLFRNNGDGTFTEMAARAGVAGPDDEWTTGCTFVDYDRDGFLDLFTASYVGFDLARTPKPGQFAFCRWKEAPVYCGPRGLPYGRTTLFRNRGDGTFEDVSAKAGIRVPQGIYGFTAVAADLNEDGWTDIYLACDSTPSLFFRNNRDGTFTELGTETSLAYNENGAEQAGMGVAVRDYDHDGHLDVMKTNFIGDYPNLYRNLGKGLFDDLALPAGLAVNPGYVVWGASFVDLDNDGWEDVFQVTGHVYPEAEAIDPDEPYRGPRLVYRNLGGGKFEDVTHLAGPGAAAEHASRGAAFGDYDNDGDIDILIMNMGERPSLLRNDLKAERHWIQLKLEGTKSNRSAIGAVVRVHASGDVQTAAVLSQSSFLSQNDLRLHFGLGAAEAVEKIEVRWPSGASETFPGVAADNVYLLVEGSRECRQLSVQP